jgi:hypothetical protein
VQLQVEEQTVLVEEQILLEAQVGGLDKLTLSTPLSRRE